jgi:hypothetical protein
MLMLPVSQVLPGWRGVGSQDDDGTAAVAAGVQGRGSGRVLGPGEALPGRPVPARLRGVPSHDVRTRVQAGDRERRGRGHRGEHRSEHRRQHRGQHRRRLRGPTRLPQEKRPRLQERQRVSKTPSSSSSSAEWNLRKWKTYYAHFFPPFGDNKLARQIDGIPALMNNSMNKSIPLALRPLDR